MRGLGTLPPTKGRKNRGNMKDKTLYRYDISYSNDGDDTDVVLMKYPVIRETDSYYFIDPKPFYAQRKRQKKVMKRAYNTYAYDTKEAAMKHFIRRTKKRISWYGYWTRECEKALKIVGHQEEEKLFD